MTQDKKPTSDAYRPLDEHAPVPPQLTTQDEHAPAPRPLAAKDNPA
ncbi:hypothetical protein [Streptomyces milbemycinicus]|uniref:Uncharacterized protein n=1 Tax=Streptomyces milbemycinicus TaxID=476552 RepID=A0ABW8M748_9ACTN